VKDYHPVDGAVDPNMIKDKDADRAARVIIREHLEWEKENPAPPQQMSTEELKELGLQVAKQTMEIQKEHTQFKALAKFVDDDHTAYEVAQVAKAAKLALDAKNKLADAAAKAQSAALLKSVAEKRNAIAAQKAAAEAARQTAKAKQDKKNGVKPTVAPAKAAPAATAAKPNAASAKINDLKNKVVAAK
jgi:pantothenate synthetase